MCIRDRNHPVPLFLQGEKNVLNLIRAVDRADLYLVLEQIAEQLSAAGDAREADDGIAGGKILRHLDGAQDIIDGERDLDDRKLRDGPDQLRCSAS